MKIGFDAKRAFHNFRGLGNYSRNIIEGLLQTYPENEYYLYTPPFQDERAINWLNKNGKKDRLQVKLPESFLGKVSPAFWRSFLLQKDLRRHQIDVYHGLSHELPYGLKKTSLKKILTVHDLIFMRFPHLFSSVDRSVYLKKLRYSCDVADIVVAICNQTKSDLINLLKVPEEKIEVVYQSCNEIFYQDCPLEMKEVVSKKYNLPQNYILYVGAIEENKNTLNLVQAFSILKKKSEFAETKLLLVGEGKNYKAKVKEEICRMKLETEISFLNFVSVIDLPAIYQMAKLFCFPSFFEGFGIPIIEALFSKVPVITSKGSCFPESGGPRSIYIDPNSPEEIAEASERVLKNQKYADEMALLGQKYVQKFHWKNTAKNMLSVYEQ